MTEKLGERALQAMKEMNTAVVEFKVPKAPRLKKGQMKILTEERYIEVSDNNFYFFFILLDFINSILYILYIYHQFRNSAKLYKKTFSQI